MTSSKKTKAAGRTAITVVGMHRSGTSLLTRLLNLLGADLPQNLMGASKFNPTGYWESPVVRDFNDRLFELTGSSWDDWRALPDGWETSPKVGDFLEEAETILDAEFGTSSLIVFKDPRVSRLLPFWNVVLKAKGLTQRSIIALRNPVEVTVSLENRNGFKPELSYLLWLRYMLQAERDTRGHQRAIVSYENLLENWAGSVGKITKELDLVFPRGPVQIASEVNTLISPDHRHFRVNTDALDSPIISDWVRDAYSIFEHWASQKERKADYIRLDEIYLELGTAAPVFAPLLDQLKHTEKELAKRLDVIQANQARIKELADENLKAGSRLEYTERKTERTLAEKDAAAAKELTKAKAKAKTLEEEAKNARKDAQKSIAELNEKAAQTAQELKTQEKAFSELALKLNEQSESHAKSEELQARVQKKLQEEIEFEINRGKKQAEIIKVRLRQRIKLLNTELSQKKTQLYTVLTETEALNEQVQAADGLKALLTETQAELSTKVRMLDKLLAETDTLSSTLLAAEQRTKEVGHQLSQTQSALAQKDAELSDTLLEAAETGKKLAKSDKHNVTLHRINKSLKCEMDLIQTEALNLQSKNSKLITLQSQNEAAVNQMRQEFDAEIGKVRSEFAQAKSRAETSHSELAQLTNLLMQTEADNRQAHADRHQIERERDELERTLSCLQDKYEADKAKAKKEQRNLKAKLKTRTDQLVIEREQMQADIDSLRAAQADQTAALAAVNSVRKTRFWQSSSKLLERQKKAITQTGLFDADWYLEINTDVQGSGIDPLTHFIRYGLAEGRAPRFPAARQADETTDAHGEAS